MEWTQWFTQNLPTVLWLVAMVVLLIVEAATVQLVCIWFAIGALVTAIFAMFGIPVWGQFLCFALVSALTLLFTRRFVMKALKVKKTPTNADSVIGLTGTVLEEIDNLAQTGRVRVNGLDWTARSVNNETIHIGRTVLVKAIQGVKVMVEPQE